MKNNKKVAMDDKDFIADQLVNAWEVNSEEEMIDHLESETTYSKKQLEPIVEEWYDDASLRMKMDLASPNDWEDWLQDKLKSASIMQSNKRIRKQPEIKQAKKLVEIAKDIIENSQK